MWEKCIGAAPIRTCEDAHIAAASQSPYTFCCLCTCTLHNHNTVEFVSFLLLNPVYLLPPVYFLLPAYSCSRPAGSVYGKVGHWGGGNHYPLQCGELAPPLQPESVMELRQRSQHASPPPPCLQRSLTDQEAQCDVCLGRSLHLQSSEHPRIQPIGDGLNGQLWVVFAMY